MSTYKPLKSFKTKEEAQKYVKDTMVSEGLEPLYSYDKSSTPMKVKVLSGEYKGYIATIQWNNFTQGKRPDFRSLLDTEKERYIKDTFREEGYRVINISKPVRRRDKVDVISPEGNEWSVAIDTFKQGVRCPLDSNRSWGERCVASILKQSDIDYETQKAIHHEDGTIQYMDFYVEYDGKKYDIEYHGRQHYEEDPKNRLFNTLKEQQNSDSRKREYCNNNDIIFIELPYTLSTVTGVAKELHRYFPTIDLSKDFTVENFNFYKEMAEYYMNHSEYDTAKKFGVAGSTVRKNAYRLGYKKTTKHKRGGSLAHDNCS